MQATSHTSKTGQYFQFTSHFPRPSKTRALESPFSVLLPHTAPRCLKSNLLSNETIAKGTLEMHSQHGHSHHLLPRLALPVPSLLQPCLLLLQGQGMESWSEANQLGHPDISGHKTCGQNHSVVGLPGIHHGMETALTLNILRLFCASCSRLFKAKCMRCLFLEGQSIKDLKAVGWPALHTYSYMRFQAEL